MKRIQSYIFFVTIALILLLITGCGSSTGKVDENADKIDVVGVRYNKDKVDVDMPTVKNMQNKGLQDKINGNLKEAVLSLENKGTDSSFESSFSVIYLNDRLLGIQVFGANGLPSPNGSTTVQQGIHVDLTTGKVYKLSDLFQKGKNIEEEILNICKDHEVELCLVDFEEAYNWKYSEFKNNWNSKNKGQHFLLTEDFLWVFTESEDGYIPGYGIPYDLMDSFVDKESDLWKAFVSKVNRADQVENHGTLPENRSYTEQMDAEAEAKRAAAAQKEADDAQKNAYAKGATDAKAAADAAAKAAAAKKSSIRWQTTKVTNQNGKILVQGQFLNDYKYRSVTRINWSKLTFTYKTNSGAQKTTTINYSNAYEKKVPPLGVTQSSLQFNTPSDYKSYVKVHH